MEVEGMTVALTLMEAYLIETPLAKGMNKEVLLNHLQAGEADALDEFVGQFDYEDLVQAYRNKKEVITNAIQSGYKIKFVSIDGIRRLLELKFDLNAETDFKMHEDKVIGIPLKEAQFLEFENMLSSNWK